MEKKTKQKYMYKFTFPLENVCSAMNSYAYKVHPVERILKLNKLSLHHGNIHTFSECSDA